MNGQSFFSVMLKTIFFKDAIWVSLFVSFSNVVINSTESTGASEIGEEAPKTSKE